jgi:hypothetical protein
MTTSHLRAFQRGLRRFEGVDATTAAVDRRLHESTIANMFAYTIG